MKLVNETMEYFPRHYSIPRDGKIASIVVNNRHDLRRLRTELEILRRARRHVVFRCTPIGQAPDGLFDDDDHEELETILHDAEHPLVEEMIEHIDRAFPNTRKEIMMSVVNDEAQNIVQEAVEAGTIEDRNQPSTATNEAAADAAIDMLAEAEAKLAEIVDYSDSDTATDTNTGDAQNSTEAANQQQDNNESNAAAQPMAEDTSSTSNSAQDEMTPPDAVTDEQAQQEEKTEDAQALNDMEEAVVAITETPVSEPAEDSATTNSEDAPPQEAEAIDNAPPADQTPEPEIVDQADLAETDNDMAINEETSESELQNSAPGVSQPDASIDSQESDDSPVSDATETTMSQADTSIVDTSIADENFEETSSEASSTSSSDYGPERAQQAVEEIEKGIRKLANVLNTQVKDQWTQASEVIEDIVEKRTQLEQKLFDAKDMLEKLDRSRKEADISRDAADVARREAELFRDDLRKLRDDETKNK